MIRLLAFLLLVSAAPIAAQQARLCDWQASAQALVEPWNENTRVFANGNVRVAGLSFDALSSNYDPAIGLIFTLPVQVDAVDGGASRAGLSRITFNQSTGAMTTDIELGSE